MKNIIKFLAAFFAVSFLVISCNNDADRDWTKPEASFTLDNTMAPNNVLYPTMASNSFRLFWDNVGAASYTVEVSSTEDFAKPVELGTSTTNSLTTTIDALNTALIKAGLVPYKNAPAFIRIKTNSAVSNIISFNATTYPSAKPIITEPIGKSIVLKSDVPDDIATTIKWSDYKYGVDVVYLVEMAPKGTSNFIKIGMVNNIPLLDLSNLTLNKYVLKLGGLAGVAADYDVRVTATTKSVGGTITNVSDVATINITPYQLESYMYALGGFNGWSHDTAEILTSATSDGVYVGYINFPAAGTEFKITENRNWDVNYGDDGADGTLEPNGANIKSPGAGYHKITVDLNTNTITIVPEIWGVIGDATPNAWNSPDTSMTWNGATKTWEVTMYLNVGEIKFRKNNDWAVNYGDDGTDGTLNLSGKNIPVTSAGTYKVIFDEMGLSYNLIKQ